MDTEDLLNTREQTHGDYSLTAEISQSIKLNIRQYGEKLSDTQRESLDLIATKIARILSGDADYLDNWDDIAGYAKLVSRALTQDNKTS